MKLGTDVLRPPLRVSAQLIEMELNFIQGGSLWFLRVLLRQEREARTHQASSPAWCSLWPLGGALPGHWSFLRAMFHPAAVSQLLSPPLPTPPRELVR